MADETAQPVEPKTRREELTALLVAMGEEQADAMDVLYEYLFSPPVQEFRLKLSEAAEKTIPNSMYESTLTNVFTVLDALVVVLPQARASLPKTDAPEEAPAA